MIKGVNRQVIEITQTKCEYFEKVLFSSNPNTPQRARVRCASGQV